jgi:hypothetical protein
LVDIPGGLFTAVSEDLPFLQVTLAWFLNLILLAAFLHSFTPVNLSARYLASGPADTASDGHLSYSVTWNDLGTK